MNWEDRFNKRFVRKSRNPENKGACQDKWFLKEGTTAQDVKEFIHEEIERIRKLIEKTSTDYCNKEATEIEEMIGSETLAHKLLYFLKDTNEKEM